MFIPLRIKTWMHAMRKRCRLFLNKQILVLLGQKLEIHFENVRVRH